MKRFWSYHGWEALLCLAASAALVLNFSQGFYIPDTVANSVPLALLICAAALLYAYFGSYNRVTMVCFSLGFVVLAAAFFLWMRSAGIDIVDEEGSSTAVYIYYIAAPLISLISFLLSRSRLGTVVLFLLGICLNALLDFLNFAVKPWCTALFVLAVAALFLLRQYRATALRSSTVNPNFGRYFGLLVGVSAAGVLLAAACWGLIIRPLQPPTLDLELLTKYMRYEVLEMVGIARQYPVPDDWNAADETDESLQGNEPEQEEEDAPPQEENPDLLTTPDDSVPDNQSAGTNFLDVSSVSYGRNVTGYLVVLIILVVLAILAVPLLRRLLRKRRLARLTGGTTQEQVVGLYRFYLKKFARIGCPRAPAQTEWEYADRYGERLAPYLEGGLSLEQMTRLYMDARYGGLSAPEEDCKALAALYPVFLRQYRELAGRFRYLTKYFVL